MAQRNFGRPKSNEAHIERIGVAKVIIRGERFYFIAPDTARYLAHHNANPGRKYPIPAPSERA